MKITDKCTYCGHDTYRTYTPRVTDRTVICIMAALILAFVVADHILGVRYNCEQRLGGELIAVENGVMCVLPPLKPPEPRECPEATSGRIDPSERNGSTSRAAGNISEEPWQLVSLVR